MKRKNIIFTVHGKVIFWHIPGLIGLFDCCLLMMLVFTVNFEEEEDNGDKISLVSMASSEVAPA